MSKLSVMKASYHALRHDWERFEHEPAVQLRYHRKMIIFWMINLPIMNIIAGLDIAATLGYFPAKVALLLTAIILWINTNYSLYANWDTEVGDAHAAYAGVKAEEIAEEQKNANSKNKTR